MQSVFDRLHCACLAPVSHYRVRLFCLALGVSLLGVSACGGGRVDPGFYAASEWSDHAADQRAVVPVAKTNALFARPKLVVIRADWCPYCRTAQPAIDAAYERFRGRVDLVVLDVTDDASANEAERAAVAEGVDRFFAAYRGRTPTLGIFVAPGEGRRVHGNMEDPETLTEAMNFALDAFRARRATSSRSDTATAPRSVASASFAAALDDACQGPGACEISH